LFLAAGNRSPVRPWEKLMLAWMRIAIRTLPFVRL